MSIENQVLVVDDEAEIVVEIIDALDGAGFHCHGATSVDSALTLLRGQPDIDLIVTDLKMPGKSGEELIIEARKFSDRKFIFIIATGHGHTTSMPSLREHEVFATLRKPIDIETLIEIVHRAVKAANLAERSSGLINISNSGSKNENFNRENKLKKIMISSPVIRMEK